MLVHIGLFTYLTASASFTVLGVLLVLYRRATPLGPSLAIACGATAIWAAIVAADVTAEDPHTTLIYLGELARDGCWLFILLQLLGLQNDGLPWSIGGWQWRRWLLPLLIGALVLIALPSLLPNPPLQTGLCYQLVVGMWLVLSVLGLLLIEQLFRNASLNARWSIKYLCLGLGALFAYDFFMYAQALLFRKLDTELWQARGLVNALATPLLAIAITRFGNWQINLHLSRQAVFHSVTLIGAGLYLLGMAAAGYFIKYLGGSWGGVLQTGFLVAAAALLICLLFSGKLRAQIRVFLSKHFFNYGYDYREEWLKFTQALAGPNDNVAEGIILAMAPLANSPAGLLWFSDDGHQPMSLLARWQMPPPEGVEGLKELPAWLDETDWIIDLDEWRRTPDLYGNLSLPLWLQENDQLWLIIPLIFGDHLEAVLMLKKSALKHSINWEDRDLLKTAGRQAATHLAQHLASKALIEARQFDAFNRLSAYVVHDLKNILAQQSLIVSNASKHRDNPAFVTDMISTVENSVARMQRLMTQMRSGIRSTSADSICLPELLCEVIQARAVMRPAPCGLFAGQDDTPKDDFNAKCAVEADRERLATVFSHLIQNAQEATTIEGAVVVHMNYEENQAKVDIVDNGRGMDADFIHERLFRPFESTKGLTGMGIGVFESREYIRLLGGDITVASTLGEGTTFHVTLPLIAASASGSITPSPAATGRSPLHVSGKRNQLPSGHPTETIMANYHE